MLININNPNTDPYYNLALEEYMFNHAQMGNVYVMFWRNSPAVIVGKNQNTIAEVNGALVEKNNIQVVRRLSGGGAVYHDLGNLNFTIIDTKFAGRPFNFADYIAFIALALSSLGVKVDFSGKNDLLVDGKKFSGNAQYYSHNKLLHHGTILYQTDLEILTEVLTPSTCKLENKGIVSIRSRVANLIDLLPAQLTLGEFSGLLLKTLANGQEIMDYDFKENDSTEIARLMSSKYRQWDWNYGASPPCNIIKQGSFPDGTLQIHLNVQDGVIKTIKFYGDFFTFGDFGQ